MIQKCLDLISAQQGKDAGDMVYQVGEHLKDIVRETPGAAALVAADITQKGMGLADAEKKIAEAARKNKKNNCGAVGFYEADDILRAFYGLAKRGERPAAAPVAEKPKAVNILDLLGV